MEPMCAPPGMDTETPSDVTEDSEGACCKEGPPDSAGKGPPRVDSSSEMDTRPPLTPETMMALDMDSHTGRDSPVDAFHMHGLLSELPELSCQSGEPQLESSYTDRPRGDQEYQESSSQCPPCPLHIAIGKGQPQMVSRSSESDLQASTSRGLFMTDHDTGELYRLFQYEGGTLADGSTGTPLATLDGLTTNEEPSGAVMWETDGTAPNSPLTTLHIAASLPEAQISQQQRPLQEDSQETQMLFPHYPPMAKVPGPCEPEDLLVGVIFGARYLGSTQLECERHQMANTRMRQAQEAVDRVKVFIQKQPGDVLGVTIVESGWGSLLPTVVIANLMHGGPAERSGELSIGDHVISVNGTSLVGLPFSTCQGLIRELKGQSEVTLSIVHCPPVVTAIIHRPNTTHQLGFCVEDGVICSLVRGGIAEKGGIRVGHRIIEINGQSVVATSHEKIIRTLLDATGEVHIKTMPASTYKLLTGQETPTYL
ncbi:amyloid-beta A4 precursor protein-binding family A member 3 [Mantella aurantiaca]